MATLFEIDAWEATKDILVTAWLAFKILFWPMIWKAKWLLLILILILTLPRLIKWLRNRKGTQTGFRP